MSDTTTTTTTTIASNIHLTQEEFAAELVICRGIFINYTHYHVSAALYHMVSEEMYWGNSLHLNSLLLQLESYWYNTETGTYYCGGIEVSEYDIILVIDFIHHFGEIDYTLAASKFGGGTTGPDEIIDPDGSATTTTTTTTESTLTYPGYSARFINHECEIIYTADPTTTTTTTAAPDIFVVKAIDYVCEEIDDGTTSTTTTTSTSTTSTSTTTTTTEAPVADNFWNCTIIGEGCGDDTGAFVLYSKGEIAMFYTDYYLTVPFVPGTPITFGLNSVVAGPAAYTVSVAADGTVSNLTLCEGETTTTTTTEGETTTTTTTADNKTAYFNFGVNQLAPLCSINYVKLNGVYLTSAPVIVDHSPQVGVCVPGINANLEISWSVTSELDYLSIWTLPGGSTQSYQNLGNNQTHIIRTTVTFNTLLQITASKVHY